MKVTFEQQGDRLDLLKQVCRDNPYHSVNEIKSIITSMGEYSFNHATIRQYLDQQYYIVSIRGNSFQNREAFSDNEMDYGTELPHFKWDELSQQEKMLSTN